MHILNRVVVIGNGIDGDYASTDYCVLGNPHMVYDYTCVPLINQCVDGDVPVSLVYPCDEGEYCLDGRCIPDAPEFSCTDSEGGIRTVHRYTTGNVIQMRDGVETGEYTDACSAAYQGYDYLCTEYGTYSYETFYCPISEVCRDGACVPETIMVSCTRTEATPERAGYVTGSDGVIKDDICGTDSAGNSIVITSRCSSDGLPEEDPANSITCPRGCENGLCV